VINQGRYLPSLKDLKFQDDFRNKPLLISQEEEMRLHKSFLTAAILLVAIALLIGCAPQVVEREVVVTATPEAGAEEAAEGAAETEAEVPAAGVDSLYVVYVPKLVHPWYDDVKQGADRAIEELAKEGVTVKYDWDAPPEADVVMHTQRLEDAIAKEPDVLAVSCLDVAADKPLIEEAQERGIHVISFDTPCPDTPVESFVGRYDYVADGAEVAEYLAEALGGEGQVAILLGSPGAANHQLRTEGFKQVMEEYPDIEIVAEEYDNDDVERAVNLTASMLQAHPDLDAIYGVNASNPIGAGRAIVEAGKKGEVLLIGMDDMPDMVNFVKDGTAIAMSVQNVPQIGYWTINYAVALTDGHTVPEIHDTGSLLVKPDMVDTYK
jgi:ribose transport system substrate-binding protein